MRPPAERENPIKLAKVHKTCDLSQHRWHVILLNGYSYWHSGEQLLEIVSGDSLTFGDEEAGFPHYSLEDAVQQLITQSVKEAEVFHFKQFTPTES